MRSLAILNLAWVMLLQCGCSNKKPLAQVEGTVSLNGKGLADLQVVFVPDPEIGSEISSAYTDEQGRYVLTVEATGAAGAIVGRHTVILRDLTVWKAMGNEAARENQRIPERYTVIGDSPFKPIEVKPDQVNSIDLKIVYP